MAKKKSRKRAAAKPEQSKPSPAELTKADRKTLDSLRGMADSVVESANRRRTPHVDIPSRSLSNVRYNKSKKFIEMGSGKNRRELFNLSQAKSYMQTMLVGSGCKQLIEQSKTTSIRGLYYLLKHTIEGTREETFDDQSDCDPIIEDVEVTLNALREELHVYASNRGSMVGQIVLNDSGDEIDCSRMGSGGYTIPSIVEPEVIRFEKVEADFVLHVEKDTVWRRFNEDKFWRTHNCILTHGQGQPPRGVRRLLHRLHYEHNLPVYCLLDNDPWGYYIYSVIKQGSINLAYESRRMAIPEARFMGLRSKDYERCDLSPSVVIKLNDNDVKRVKQIRSYPWFERKAAWKKELDLMLKNGFKLEVEALISKDISYVTETYVRNASRTGIFLTEAPAAECDAGFDAASLKDNGVTLRGSFAAPTTKLTSMFEIDGSVGEGGGQIVRSALAVSLVTGRPLRFSNIRAGRRKPGLQRQHLTAVAAAVDVGQATCHGAELQSKRLEFVPTSIRGGDYRFDIGSAGSTSLVLQTVLPALWLAEEPSRIVVSGGTHNPLAPPFDFLAASYFPLVESMGPRCEAELQRPGFYPAGGGSLRVSVEPVATLGPLTLLERGKPVRKELRCLVAKLPEHVGRREVEAWRRLSGWKQSACKVDLIGDSAGPGNVVLAELQFERLTEVFSAFGKQGLPAEQVARNLHREVKSYLASSAPVGPHLADQLLLPMAIGAWQGTGGGSFVTGPLTDHTQTHIDLLREFLGVDVSVVESDAGDHRIDVTQAREPSQRDG